MHLTPLMKRVLIGAGILVAAGIFGFIMYVVLFGLGGDDVTNGNTSANTNGSTLPTSNTGTGGTNALPNVNGISNGNTPISLPDVPTVAQGGVTMTDAVTTTAADGFVVSVDGSSTRYYDRVSGRLYERSADGTLRELSSQVFPQVEDLQWSPTGEAVLLTFPDGRTILFDIEAQRQYSLPTGSREFSFAQNGAKITYKHTIGGEDFLVVSNPDGTGIEAIADLGANGGNVIPTWSPANDIVAVEAVSVNGEQQEVFPIGLRGENFKSFTVDGYGFQGVWSPNGTRLLYSVHNSSSDYNPRLWVVDALGEAIGDNHLSVGLTTWAEKCVFASETQLYCAVPDALPSSSGLYPELAVDVTDSIYVVDLTTSTRRLVAVPLDEQGGAFRVTDLRLDSAQSVLYFTDARSSTVRQLKLK